MSEIPFYFSLAVLGLILTLREMQNARMIKHLIDRLLVKNDLEPLPDENLGAGIITASEEETPDVKKKLASALNKLIEDRKKRQITFRIPGMAAGMGDIVRPKEK